MAGVPTTSRPSNPARDAFPYRPTMPNYNLHMDASFEHRRTMDWHHRRLGAEDRACDPIDHGRAMNRMPPRIGMPVGGGGNHTFNPGIPLGLDRRIERPGILHPEGRNVPRRMDGFGLLHAGAEGSRRPGLLDVSTRRIEGPDPFLENPQRRVDGPGLLRPGGGMVLTPGILHPQGDYGVRGFEASALKADVPGILRLEHDHDWRPGNDEPRRMLRHEENLAARRMEGRLQSEHEDGFWRGDVMAKPRPENMNTLRRSEGPLPDGNRGRMEDSAFFRRIESPALLQAEGDGLLSRTEGSGLSHLEGNIAGRRREPATHIEIKKLYRRMDGPDIAAVNADRVREQGPNLQKPELAINYKILETSGTQKLGTFMVSRTVDGPPVPSSWRKYGDTQLKDNDGFGNHNVSPELGTATLGKRLEDAEDSIIDNLEKSAMSLDEGTNKLSVFDVKAGAPLARSSKGSRTLQSDKIVSFSDNRLDQNRKLGRLSMTRRQGTESLSPSDDGKGSRSSLPSTGSGRLRVATLPSEEDNDKTRGILSEDENVKDSDDGSMRELVMQYKVALAELTFNSKPIITNLTIIAGENLHAANVIATIICDHILEVPIEQKLPCLYLLDSIIKNIRSTYVNCFGSRLPEIFIKSYRQMDPSLHPAMQHLFKTWRGIYDEPLHVIERELDFNFLGNNATSLSALPLSNSMKMDVSSSHWSGPSIHVNPKYLEAQQQKVKQPSPVNDPPQIHKVSDAPVEVADPVKIISKPNPHARDYDTGVWEEERSRAGESFPSKKWAREDGSVAVAVENVPLTHGTQSGLELQKLAPEPLLDIYGNVRGIRGLKVPPAFTSSNSKNLSAEGSWKIVDAEYCWGDANLRRRDVGTANDSLKRTKVEKLHYGDLLSKRGKAFSMDPPLEFDGSAEASGLKDWKDVDFLQQDHRSEPTADPILEVPNFERSGHDMGGYHPAGVQSPSSLPQIDTVLPHSLQVNQNSSSPARPVSAASMPISGLVMVTNFSALSRPGGHFDIGSSSGQGVLNFGSSSPHILPSAFQQSQQLERPSSPSLSLFALPNVHSRGPLSVSSDMQSLWPSSQAPPLPLPPPPSMHLSQRPHLSQYVSQGIQRPFEACQMQISNQSLTQNMLILPHVSTKLRESLQQLQHQVPSISIGQSVRPELLLGQPGNFVQHSLNHSQLPIQVDTGGASGVRHGEILPLPAGASPSISTTDNLPSVFISSEAKPSAQASHIIANATMLSVRPNMEASESCVYPPPLPSGPPPFAYSAEANLLPAQLVPPTFVTGSSTNGPPQAYTSTWVRQPPLPPGPPPVASQIEGLKMAPTVPSCLTSTPGTDITSLLSSLVAHGVISAVSQAASHAQAVANIASEVNGISSSAEILSLHLPIEKIVPFDEEAQRNPGPFDFKQEHLRDRQEAVINALYYEFPRQCKTCGLRFKLQEEHCNHMDWHVSRNRRQNPLKKISRKWFVSVKEWLNGAGLTGNEVAPSFPLEEPARTEEKDELVAVPADESQSACALCGEPFENFYSDEMDEWMYEGAVYMNASVGSSLDATSRGPIVHAKCRSESATDSISDPEFDIGSSRIKRPRLRVDIQR